jgi:hypothetical protein
VPHNSIKLALATLAAMVATNACTAAQLGVWEEDLRRCMIYKPIDGGRVAVANDEGAIEIEVQGERAASRALTSCTSNPFCSRISKIGIQ